MICTTWDVNGVCMEWKYLRGSWTKKRPSILRQESNNANVWPFSVPLVDGLGWYFRDTCISKIFGCFYWIEQCCFNVAAPGPCPTSCDWSVSCCRPCSFFSFEFFVSHPNSTYDYSMVKVHGQSPKGRYKYYRRIYKPIHGVPVPSTF